MAVQRARLCIVSREPFQSAHFVAALHSTLGLEDDLEIIVDRRHSESSGWRDLKEDRRRLSELDVELKANGFAIVPAVDWTERIDRSRADGDDRKLEDIRDFLRGRPGTLRPKLTPKLVGVLSCLTLAALGVLLAWHLPLTGLEKPVVAARSPSTLADRAPNSEAGATSTRADSPRDADRITPRPRETSEPHRVSGAASQEAGIAPGEISLPPREVRAAPRESSAPRASTAKATSTPVEKSYRAELVGKPIARGWGDSYAVRVLDSAGAPLADASVQLVVSMADGTVEHVAMGALAEPGTYRGTVPTNRSTAVDLKLRVTSSGESVDVPLSR